MSESRRSSATIFVLQATVVLILGSVAVLSWQPQWLPASFQPKFKRSCAEVGEFFTKLWRVTSDDKKVASLQQDQDATDTESSEEETDNVALGDQFEPAQPDELQRTASLPARERQVLEEEPEVADDPVLSPAGRNRVQHRTIAKALPPDDSDDPFDRSRRRPDAKIKTAAFQDESIEPAPVSGDNPKLPAVPRIASKKSKRIPESDAATPRPLLHAKTAKPIGAESSTDANQPLLDLSEIDKLAEEGDLMAAQRELSRIYWKSPAQRPQLKKRLEDYAQTLYFSPQPMFHEPYVVQPGDQLRVIAQRYQLSWEYLSRLNHVEPKNLRMGRKLKVVDGPFSALVILSNYELIIHLNGTYVRSYRVGVGKDGTTPIGTFKVKNKVKDPTYFGPDGVIAHDDPQNPLGERWLDIGDSYGIHGTIEPKSIGRNDSRGCVRMLNSDVEEVYDLLVLGSEVKIQR